MHNFDELLSTWSSVLGTLLSVLAVFQSKAWVAIAGAIFAGTSIGAVLYAKRQRLVIDSATLSIGGRSIDSLNIANLARQRTSSLVVQEARHTARIVGEDLHIVWQYSGYCRAERETAMVFSVDSENNIPFEQLVCFAYDLQHDPGRTHKIHPLLLSADSISKKLAVPFLLPVTEDQPFSVVFECALPGCMKAGLQYYTSTLSFDQPTTDRFEVRLLFADTEPEFVRAYSAEPGSSPRLLKDLRPLRDSLSGIEYVDADRSVAGNCTRIYMFRRNGLTARAA